MSSERTGLTGMTGKTQAQKRVDRIHEFRQELAALSRDGVLVLSDEQQARLEHHLNQTLQDLSNRYDVDINRSQKQISVGMRIVSTLGGLAFCAAVFLFFFRFWGLIPVPGQIAILAGTPILLLISVDWVSRRERTHYYTSLLAIVALAAFGLNLGQLGQIYNIAPSPNAFLVWGLLALILAYSYRLRLPLAGGIIAISIFFAAMVMHLGGYYWAEDQMPENYLLAGILILALRMLLFRAGIPEFDLVYSSAGLLLVFITLFFLGNAGQISWIPALPKTIQGVYQALGFLAAGSAIWYGIRRQIPTYVNLGSTFFAIYLFNRVYSWWWNWIPKYLFFFLMGAIALALLALFRKIRGRTGVPSA
jgi:uncharacterized membrane protein